MQFMLGKDFHLDRIKASIAEMEEVTGHLKEAATQVKATVAEIIKATFFLVQLNPV